MRKHLTVFMLCLRTKAYRILLLSAAAAAGNIAAYYLFHPVTNGFLMPGNTGKFFIFFFMGIQLLASLLCTGTSKKKSREAYTLQRLLVSERWVFLWDCLAASLCFAFLWMAEMLSMYIIAMAWTKDPSYILGPQGITMMFYESYFLHGLIPLAETVIWIRNGILIAAEGILTAFQALGIRRKKRASYSSLPLITYASVLIPAEAGESSAGFAAGLSAIIALAVLGAGLFKAAGGGRREEDPDDE